CTQTDSSGTRVTFIDGSLTLGDALPEPFGATPAGEMPSSCVHEIPNGARIDTSGVVTLPDGRQYRIPTCTELHHAPYTMIVTRQYDYAGDSSKNVSATSSGTYAWGEGGQVHVVALLNADLVGQVILSPSAVEVTVGRANLGRGAAATPSDPVYRFLRATPCSSMRMASRPSTSPNRLDANPGESFTRIGSFPSARANATARSTAAAAARGCRTISTSFIAWTGLKKCSPTTRPGSRTAPAMAATESDEVLVASSASAGAVRSSSTNNRCLTPRSSTTASITTSASRTAAESSRSGRSRAATALRSVSFSLPRFTPPWSRSPIRRIARGIASDRLSVSRTSNP